MLWYWVKAPNITNLYCLQMIGCSGLNKPHNVVGHFVWKEMEILVFFYNNHFHEQVVLSTKKDWCHKICITTFILYSSLLQQIHKRIIWLITWLGKSIFNIKEIQWALRLYVKIKLFEEQHLPQTNSRRFYLEERYKWNHMYNATAKWENIILKILFTSVHPVTRQHL